jgi:N-acetylneuraminic acid mutarotase
MKKIYIILILFPFLTFSQSWTNVSNFIGDGRHHPITFSNDNYGFVVSGSYLNDVFKYDKSSDTWSQLQDFPGSGRGYSYGVSIGNKAYLGFGSTDNGTFPIDWWEYDMNNDSWLQLSSFIGSGRNHPAMIVVNNKIYVGCGSNDNGNLGDWWEYDVNLDSWSQKSDVIGNNRHHPFYFGVGNYAYVGFGHGSVTGPGSNPSANSYIYNDFYRYDPSNDSWLQLSNFPSEARVAGTQFTYNDKGYILSGDGDDHNPLNNGEFWEYDPINDVWNQLASHPGDAIWAPGNFVIGCDVYFLLGQNNNYNTPSLPVSVVKYKLDQQCGCTDSSAFNFSTQALTDDGSCCYISGCTDPNAINYSVNACYDDGSCTQAVLGCMNPTASNYNSNANVSTFFGGAMDNNIGSGSYFYNNQHLIFDSYDNCLIKSCDVYAEDFKNITFELRNNNGNIIDDTTLSISPGKQKIILNFDVPIATNLQLGIANNNSGLFRNNTGSNYPYNIADMLNIKGSSASQPGYYYFFYNIEVNSKCLNTTGIQNTSKSDLKLEKVFNILGSESLKEKNKLLFYLYEDGTVKKKIIF